MNYYDTIKKLIEDPKYFETTEGKKQLEIILRNVNGKCMYIINGLIESIASESPVLTGFLSEIAQRGMDALTQKAYEELPMISETLSITFNQYTQKVLALWSSVKENGIVQTAMDAFSNGLTLPYTGDLARINDKLNQLSSTINEIYIQVQAIINDNINEKFFEPARDIVYVAQHITDDLNRGNIVEAKRIEDLLRYINKKIPTIMDFHEVDIGLRLEILYEILPIATNMLNLYYAEYFECLAGSKHTVHEYLKNILNKLSSPEFCAKIEDYYYLKEEKSSRNVSQIIKCHKLVCQNLIASIDDTFALRSGTASKEEYKNLCLLSDQLAEALAGECVLNMKNQSKDPEVQKKIIESAKHIISEDVAKNTVATNAYN